MSPADHSAEHELSPLINELKKSLDAFPEGLNVLDVEIENSLKHLPPYLNIVKSHIEQLAKVLSLESHNCRNLDTIELAEPVRQLMQLFKDLDDQDLRILEELSSAAKNWQSTLQTEQSTDSVESSLPTASEA